MSAFCRRRRFTIVQSVKGHWVEKFLVLFSGDQQFLEETILFGEFFCVYNKIENSTITSTILRKNSSYRKQSIRRNTTWSFKKKFTLSKRSLSLVLLIRENLKPIIMKYPKPIIIYPLKGIMNKMLSQPIMKQLFNIFLILLKNVPFGAHTLVPYES